MCTVGVGACRRHTNMHRRSPSEPEAFACKCMQDDEVISSCGGASECMQNTTMTSGTRHRRPHETVVLLINTSCPPARPLSEGVGGSGYKLLAPRAQEPTKSVENPWALGEQFAATFRVSLGSSK